MESDVIPVPNMPAFQSPGIGIPGGNEFPNLKLA